MQSSAHTDKQVIHRKSVSVSGGQRTDETIRRAQLTKRLTANTGYVVLQIRVFETADDLLDISRMLLRIKAVFFNEAVPALFHGCGYDTIDLLVSDGFVDGREAPQCSQICGDAVS